LEARGRLDEANENLPPYTNPMVVEIHLWISEVSYFLRQYVEL